jgi:hypothetical protein
LPYSLLVQTIMERYVNVRSIGEGTYGTAMLVHDRLDETKLYVVKRIDTTRLKQEEIIASRQEAQVRPLGGLYSKS